MFYSELNLKTYKKGVNFQGKIMFLQLLFIHMQIDSLQLILHELNYSDCNQIEITITTWQKFV